MYALPLSGTLCLSLMLAPAGLSAMPFTSGGVTVSESGEVRASSGASLGSVPLPRPPLRLAVDRREVEGNELLHVQVLGDEGRAGELLVDMGRANKVVFSGATGPQGVDGEWSRHLEVTARGVIQYQRRGDGIRCDGKPALLFPRRYDFAASKFRPVSALDRWPGLPVITATRDPAEKPAGPPLNTYRLTFASTAVGDEEQAARLGAPLEAQDGRMDTAWAEEKGGFGAGELFVAAAGPSPYRLRMLSVLPGDAASPRRFQESNRLRKVVLVLSPSRAFRVDFPRDPASDMARHKEPFWVTLPDPSEGRCVTLVVEEVYPGEAAKRRGDGGRTAISEVGFYTDLDLSDGVARLMADLAGEDPLPARSAVGTIAGLGQRGVELLEPRLGQGASPLLLRRAAEALARTGSPAALAPLAALLPRLLAVAEDGARGVALDALARGGEASLDLVLPMLERAEGPLREELVRLLGRLGGERARAALLGLVGQGPRDLRRLVARTAAGVRGRMDPRLVLEAALEPGAAAERRADLLYVLARLEPGQGEPAAGTGSPGAPGLPLSADDARRLSGLWDGAPFEVRFRLLQALGRLAPEDAGELILQASSVQDDPALRREAVHWLPGLPGERASAALAHALDDADPAVRAEAVQGLEGPGLALGVQRKLAARLLAERWGMVAGALADVLGRHCSPEGVAALREAVRHGSRGHSVDRRALEGMARCRPRGLGPFLLSMAENSDWRTELRKRALALVDRGIARGSEKELLNLFEALRTRAVQSEADEQVAMAAAGAVAKLGTDAAAGALADALALEPLPTLRIAAALALGEVCARGAMPTLQRARADQSAKVRGAAEQALRRCNHGKPRR